MFSLFSFLSESVILEFEVYNFIVSNGKKIAGTQVIALNRATPHQLKTHQNTSLKHNEFKFSLIYQNERIHEPINCGPHHPATRLARPPLLKSAFKLFKLGLRG